jgi:hypothetical protein
LAVQPCSSSWAGWCIGEVAGQLGEPPLHRHIPRPELTHVSLRVNRKLSDGNPGADLTPSHHRGDDSGIEAGATLHRGETSRGIVVNQSIDFGAHPAAIGPAGAVNAHDYDVLNWRIANQERLE